jgi:hypothetical protein
MHDGQLDDNELSPGAIEHLDQRTVRALETAPRVEVPADFAARVAGQLPTRRPASLTRTHYGYAAILIGMAVTFAALMAFTLHTTAHAVFGLPESLLLTQFIVLVVWFSVRRHSLR